MVLTQGRLDAAREDEDARDQATTERLDGDDAKGGASSVERATRAGPEERWEHDGTRCAEQGPDGFLIWL